MAKKYMTIQSILVVIFGILVTLIALVYVSGIITTAAAIVSISIAAGIFCIAFGYVSCLLFGCDDTEDVNKW